MKIIVTGGRNYKDFEVVNQTLNGFEITHLYVGDATGADALALEWAKSRGIPFTKFEANWTLFEGRAGPIRNGKMIKAAGPEAVLVAFPGESGTADCIYKANLAGNKVIIID